MDRDRFQRKAGLHHRSLALGSCQLSTCAHLAPYILNLHHWYWKSYSASLRLGFQIYFMGSSQRKDLHLRHFDLVPCLELDCLICWHSAKLHILLCYSEAAFAPPISPYMLDHPRWSQAPFWYSCLDYNLIDQRRYWSSDCFDCQGQHDVHEILPHYEQR